MDSPYAIDKEDAISLFSGKQSTLQEMASFKFAVTLWTDVINSGNYHDAKDSLETGLVKTAPTVIKIIKHLHVPRAIKECLIMSIMNIRLDQTLWMVYHYDNILPRRRVYLNACHFKYCVWKSHLDQHGRIDYRESARKMVSAGQFNKRISFEILCKFCLKDELRAVSSDAEFRKYTAMLTFQKHPLAFFWKCYLDNSDEMSEIKLAIRIFHNRSLEQFMLTTIDVDNWHCIEYFFDLLSEQNQISSAISLLSNPNTCWYLKQLYWKLNEAQWCIVFESIPVDIIMTFFRQFDEPYSAEFLWMRVKHTFDGESFSNLMQRTLKEKDHRELTYPLAIKFWKTADDQLKTYLTTNQTELITKHFFTSEFVLKFDPQLEFLFDLLTFASIQTRKDMILEFGDRLVVVEDFSKLNLLIDLCLPDADEVGQFKKFISESTIVRKYCRKLFSNGQFDYLDGFFNAFFPDESIIIDHKKQILESESKIRLAFIFEPKTWSMFEKFIDQVDSDASYSTPIKKQFVLEFSLCLFKDRKSIEQLDQLETLVTQFLTEEESAQLKNSVLDSLYDKLAYFVKSYADDKQKFFHADFLTKLVLWCSGSDEEVLKFKQRFSFDEIFAQSIRILTSSIRYEDIETDFETHQNLIHVDSINVKILVALDEFLKWYLVTAEKAKEYKLKKIFDFEDEQFFQDLASTAKVDKQDAGTVLKWLLSNDEEEIRKFKSQCGNDTITNVI